MRDEQFTRHFKTERPALLRAWSARDSLPSWAFQIATAAASYNSLLKPMSYEYYGYMMLKPKPDDYDRAVALAVRKAKRHRITVEVIADISFESSDAAMARQRTLVREMPEIGRRIKADVITFRCNRRWCNGLRINEAFCGKATSADLRVLEDWANRNGMGMRKYRTGRLFADFKF